MSKQLRNKTKVLSVRLEDALYEELQKYIDDNGIVKTRLVEKMVREYLDKNKST